MEGPFQFQEIKNDKLEALGLVGRGGFGAVYLAKHKDWKTQVAVKICETSSSDNNIRRSIYEEARKISKANHKYIIRLYGITMPEGICGLVMEYMENGSLERLLRDLKEEVKIPWVLRWRFISEICTGMNLLHNLSPAKVFHLDLKAANILLDEHLAIKITDFGLSKIRTSQSAGTIVGGPGGTITHYPPEYLRNINLPVTEKFDVYSFGIVIWEILSREQVYKNAINDTQIANGVQTNNRPDLKDIPIDLPEDMKTELLPLMKKCWDADPGNRPYFKDMLEDLNSKCTSYKKEIRHAATDVHNNLDDAGKQEIDLCDRFQNVLTLSNAVSRTRQRFGTLYRRPVQPTDGQNLAANVEDDTDTADSIAHPISESNVGSNPNPGAENYRFVSVSQPHQQYQQQMAPDMAAQQFMQPAVGYAHNVYNVYGGTGVMIGGQGDRPGFPSPMIGGQGGRPVFHSPVQEQPRPVEPKEPSATVTPKVLLVVSKNLGRQWKELGGWLGFTPPQIDTIEIDNYHYGAQEQAYQMLYCWHQKTGSGAKHSILASALNEIGRGDVISSANL